jgi:mannose-1-phosphate guanylyltransferase
MKAIVLVGGEGTRMRPLTLSIPKPLIPLVDRPFLHQILGHLAEHGVDEVVLSSSYLESAFASFLRERPAGPAVTWITETEPLGTAGAIANAARDLDETFLVCNGDILTDLDLTVLMAAHRARGAVATITLTQVQDARPFGLVELDESGRVLAFKEKPSEPVPGLVNAGTYVLEPEAIRGVPADRSISIERVVFPDLIARDAVVLGHPSTAYWIDVGTPEKYLQATFDVLDGRVRGVFTVAPHVDPSASVSLKAHLGRWVVIGPRVRVGAEAEIEDSVLLDGSVVGAGAKIRESILGPSSSVGAGAVLEAAVLAEGARVEERVVSRGARVGPGETLDL